MTGAWQLVLEVLAAVLVLSGSGWVLVSAVAMHRVRDAVTRVNVLSPATGMGLTSIVAGAWVHRVATEGLGESSPVKALVTIGALLLVSSVASNVLARAAVLSGAEIEPRTSPNELAPPRGEADGGTPEDRSTTES